MDCYQNFTSSSVYEIVYEIDVGTRPFLNDGFLGQDFNIFRSFFVYINLG